MKTFVTMMLILSSNAFAQKLDKAEDRHDRREDVRDAKKTGGKVDQLEDRRDVKEDHRELRRETRRTKVKR